MPVCIVFRIQILLLEMHCSLLEISLDRLSRDLGLSLDLSLHGCETSLYQKYVQLRVTRALLQCLNQIVVGFFVVVFFVPPAPHITAQEQANQGQCRGSFIQFSFHSMWLLSSCLSLHDCKIWLYLWHYTSVLGLKKKGKEQKPNARAFSRSST